MLDAIAVDGKAEGPVNVEDEFVRSEWGLIDAFRGVVLWAWSTNERRVQS